MQGFCDVCETDSDDVAPVYGGRWPGYICRVCVNTIGDSMPPACPSEPCEEV